MDQIWHLDDLSEFNEVQDMSIFSKFICDGHIIEKQASRARCLVKIL